MRKLLLGVVVAVAMAAGSAFAASPPAEKAYQAEKLQLVSKTHDGFSQPAVPAGAREQAKCEVAAEKRGSDGGNDGKRGSSGAGQVSSLSPVPWHPLLL